MAKRSGKEAFTFIDPITKTEVLQLTKSTTLRAVHGYYDLPPWDRVTGRIAFSSLEPGATEGDIYMMDRDGANLTYLAHSNMMSANGGSRCQWAVDGSRVYFADREGDELLISWMDIKTGRKESLPGSLRMVSPTEHLNVYHSLCSEYADEEVVNLREEHGVFVQDMLSGQSKRILSVADCWRIHPRRDEIAKWHLFIKHTKWSADGKRLMFVFTNEIRYAPKYGELPRVKDIFVCNADGTDLHRVGEFGNHPLWHPGGKSILANSSFGKRPGNSLVLHEAATGAESLAASCISGSGHPSFSPDGAKISVEHVLGREGYGSINIVDAASDTSKHVVQVRVLDHSHVGTHLHPVWSYDSKQLLYASDASGLAQLCVIDV